MGTVLVGYKGSARLILKKLPVRTEIYDGETLLGSLDERNNVFWDDKIYSAYKSKRKLPQFKAIYDNAAESQFDIQTEELSQEEKDTISASQRGATAQKVRQAFIDKFGDVVKTVEGGVEVDKDMFLEIIKGTFGTGFNKFGGTLARWSLDDTLSDNRPEEKQRFITALGFLVDAHENEYDEDFNGLKPKDIIKKFSENIKEQSTKEKAEAEAIEETETDYTIVAITSDEEAQSYYKYLAVDGSTTNSQWCITRSSWDSYVGDFEDGKAELFYFLLKDGFDKIKRVPEKTAATPLDEYGLSMIAVSVKEDGSLKTATCRWNHANGGNDNMFTPGQISQLIGKSFYKACPPKTDPEERISRIAKATFPIVRVGNKTMSVLDGKLYLLENKTLIRDDYDYPYVSNKYYTIKDNDVQIGWLLQIGSEEHMALDMDLNIIFKPEEIKVRDVKEKFIKLISGGKEDVE